MTKQNGTEAKKNGKAEAAKAGRPTKRTPEVVAMIRQALGVGLSYDIAAKFAGVTRQTIWNWKKEDPAFFDELEKVRAATVVGVAARLVNLINEGNLGAMCFFLKTRTKEFRERKPEDERPNEEKAKQIADLIDSMNGNVLAGARSRVDAAGPESRN